MKKKSTQLIFVYNANSGSRNAILDSMHKVFSPSTYQCNLCDITFGLVSENKEWKKFREESVLQMDFLHKDEFVQHMDNHFAKKYSLPIVLVKENEALQVLVETEELNQLGSAKELIDLIQKRT
ncbi:GTPase [Flagellimonas algicola]|uniref:GTPase n=1 Tax=Flagellimonas algicola TaxID=2583815 RepID=A0ABY2WH56_9FLAO|nr:GTPase [Allomuricauda algicola]TMU50914.1 GTPase [Allomuricauda algicola]